MPAPASRHFHSGSKISLGFSPCPNDTFMFDALIHHKIDTEGLRFDLVMDDVESLNQRVLRNEPDVSKISFAAFLKATDQYVLLNAGAALGKGVGPLLVSKKEEGIMNRETLQSFISDLRIAIPGKNTTANFLFTFFFPKAKNKMEMVFSEIEDAVLSGKADAGIIIHENRFTYQQKGLHKLCDLGELWENETGEPIPLGGVAVKKILPDLIKEKLGRVMKRSIEYAFSHPDSSAEFVKLHAQDMDEEVRKKHIALYVNDYSVDLGEKGRHAIETMFSKALETGLIDVDKKNIFVNPLVFH